MKHQPIPAEAGDPHVRRAPDTRPGLRYAVGPQVGSTPLIVVKPLTDCIWLGADLRTIAAFVRSRTECGLRHYTRFMRLPSGTSVFGC